MLTPEMKESFATFRRGTLSKLCFLLLVDLDLVLTVYALGRGFVELNPVMARVLANPGHMMLVKGLAPLLIAWLVPGKLLLPATVFMVLVNLWNITSLLFSL